MESYIAPIHEQQIEHQSLSEVFELAVMGSSAGIWDWTNVNSDDGWWSPRFYELLGYEPNEVPASLQNFEAMLHPEDKDKCFQYLQKHFEHKTKFKMEYRLKTKSGKYKWFLGTGQAKWDENNRPIRVVGTIVDIDKRKKAEKELKLYIDELEFKNKELEQFTYITSHDLQEPLRTITGFTKLLQKNYGENVLDEKGQKCIKYINEASHRMSALIKDLLDYSRIGRKKQLSTVDFNEVVRTIQEDLSAKILNSHAVFYVEKLPIIEAYETEIRLLLQNLITNGIKFIKSDTPPKIWIWAERKKRSWNFFIKDNGIGIESFQKDKIFGIFQRLHPRNEFDGSGIGLAHCQKIVDLHRGKIWVESIPNEGSTFCFTILD